MHSRINTPYSTDLCQFTQIRNYQLFIFLIIQNKDNIMHIDLKEYNQRFLKDFSTLRYFVPYLLIQSLKFKCAALYSTVICKCKISSQSSLGLILTTELCSIWAFFWQSWSKELVFILFNPVVPSSGKRRCKWQPMVTFCSRCPSKTPIPPSQHMRDAENTNLSGPSHIC